VTRVWISWLQAAFGLERDRNVQPNQIIDGRIVGRKDWSLQEWSEHYKSLNLDHYVHMSTHRQGLKSYDTYCLSCLTPTLRNSNPSHHYFYLLHMLKIPG
jgi:hypothetical protein